MNKKTAIELFEKIHKEYHLIKSPKFRNMQLDIWKPKYEVLIEIRDYLKDDDRYMKLINAISQVISNIENLNRSKDTSPKWNNISERGINKAIPVLLKKRGTNIDFPFQWNDEKNNHRCSVSDGYWGARNYMLMDILGYFYLLKEGGDRLPKVPLEIFKDMENIHKREIELDKDSNCATPQSDDFLLSEDDIKRIENSKHWIRFDDKIFRKFTSLNLGTRDILKLIHETSQVEFKLSFPVRIRDGKKFKEKQYMMNMFSRFFEFGYIDKQIRTTDDCVRGREYFVTFNTTLGELFVHNLKTKNYDWISNDFYKLPNSAQVFYRKFLIHNNYPKVPINLTNIEKKVNLSDGNITNLLKTIESNVLEPLIQYGLIDSFEKADGLNGLKYIVKRQVKKQNVEADD